MELSRRFFLRSLVGGVATALSTKVFGEGILPVAEKILRIPTVYVDSSGARSKTRTLSEGVALLPKGGIVRALGGVYANDYVVLPKNVRIIAQESVDIIGTAFMAEEGRTDAMLELQGKQITIMGCSFMCNGAAPLFEAPA